MRSYAPPFSCLVCFSLHEKYLKKEEYHIRQTAGKRGNDKLYPPIDIFFPFLIYNLQ